MAIRGEVDPMRLGEYRRLSGGIERLGKEIGKAKDAEAFGENLNEDLKKRKEVEETIKREMGKNIIPSQKTLLIGFVKTWG